MLHRGPGAFHAALNTVNVCKYNLGWGAIGMCTHAMYEAVTHASNRYLYGTVVTDFTHVRRLLTDAYVRLVAMRLVATRASDYMRSASADDRRYLLYSPLTKAKITSEGERVITALWDVIAAKGVEKDTFFEAMAREIGLLPRLEGTVHINIGLLGKFMPNYLFAPNRELPVIGRRDDAADDSFLFDQGPTGGLGKVRFHDWRAPFDSFAHLPNVALLREQIDVLAEMLASATPDAAQQKDIDFAFGVGQLFATVPYAQLILEEAPLSGVDEALIDEIFAVLVRDFNSYAVELGDKPATTDAQARFAMRMIRRPVYDPGALRPGLEGTHPADQRRLPDASLTSRQVSSRKSHFASSGATMMKYVVWSSSSADVKMPTALAVPSGFVTKPGLPLSPPVQRRLASTT